MQALVGGDPSAGSVRVVLTAITPHARAGPSTCIRTCRPTIVATGLMTTVTDAVATARVAGRTPAMGMVGWRAEAAGSVLWRWGWFCCPCALAVPPHLWGVCATAGAALPAEAATALATPLLLVGTGPSGCGRGRGSRDGGLWRAGKCGGIGPRGNGSARVPLSALVLAPLEIVMCWCLCEVECRRNGEEPTMVQEGRWKRGVGLAVESDRGFLGAHHIRFCGAAGVPLRAACARLFSACALSTNVSTGRVGPHLTKGSW